jgi:iron complex transport system permease protein
MKPRPRATLIVLVLLLAAAGAARLVVGGETLGWPDHPEVWGLRLHRLAAAGIVGGALALGGLFLQSLLRNPLASPDLIGLAPGAGFGVMLATYLNYLATGELTRWTGVAGPALLGALGALGLVYFISQRRGLIDPAAMILVGVIVGLVFGAGTVFLQFQMPDRGQSAVRWLMGSISDETSGPQLIAAGGLVVLAVAGAVSAARLLDAASLEEDEARSVGLRVGRVRAGLFIASGALAAAAVVLAGPIGFVGLIAPHAARMAGGPRHAMLSVNSALAGAALLIAADALVKGIDLGAGRLPVGVLTAALGGPFFIVLLASRHGSA